MMNQQKAIKLEQPMRNWLDLPSDLMANILHRVGVVDILESAQKVCTPWREVCKDPAMWRVLHMDPSLDPNINIQMCKRCVDRSQGQLVDITIVDFGNDEILEYISNRCSQLKRLTVAYCDGNMYDALEESMKKFPLLEELSLYATDFSEEGIETAALYCPMLKTLKVNQQDFRHWNSWGTEEDRCAIDDKVAMYIGHNLHELRHLEMIGMMSNEGLKKILDGCQFIALNHLICVGASRPVLVEI